MHTAQSMHSSGSITNMLGPSRKQSTGQTSTQSVYLQRIQDSVTTWVIFLLHAAETFDFIQGLRATPRARRLASTESRAFIELDQRRSTHQHGSGGLVRGGIDQHKGAQQARA